MSRGRDWSVLRPGDPVPGDPAALGQVARDCGLTALALADGVAALRGVEARSAGWCSPAAEAFRARTGEALAALERARPRFATAADALSRYALAVQESQDDADRVLVRARAARDDRDAADRVRRAADEPVVQQQWAERAEQAQRRLDAAERALADVEARWWQAGSRAAAGLDEATDADGLDDGWDVLAAVAVVADVAGTASMVLGGAALVALAVSAAPAVVAGLAAASTLAGLISIAALHELWVHDRISGRRFATEAAWALAGLLTGGVAQGLRGAAIAADAGLDAPRLAGRLGRPAAAVAEGASHGVGPAQAAWQAAQGREAPTPRPRRAPVVPAALVPPAPAASPGASPGTAPGRPPAPAPAPRPAPSAGLQERRRGVPSDA